MEAWSTTHHELSYIYKAEEQYWSTRAKENWLALGDANTAFFHKVATSKKRKQQITQLEVDGQQTQNPEVIQEHIFSFYSKLFNKEEEAVGGLLPEVWEPQEKATLEENDSLIAPFSEIEVKTALDQMQGDKAPGPDGFPTLFYQKFWDIVGSDVMTLFHSFYEGRLDISLLNRGMVCLILKKGDANFIKDYRPISLLNCVYKLITKVLTTRLEKFIQRLIGQTKNAFLKGRFFLDGVVAAQEVLLFTHATKAKGVFLKLDFEKAFDRLDWSFLLNTFKDRGFSQKWVGWVQQLLQGGRVCINVNGTLTESFECTRGVGQGDPFSPLLFVFAVEGLSKILNRGVQAGLWEGLGPTLTDGKRVTHLQYADDTIIMLKPNIESVELLKRALLAFEKMSGLKINYAKSDILPINLSQSEAGSLADVIGCKIGDPPLTYWGIPIHWRKPGRSVWNDLIQKLQKKLSSWKGRFLSLGGKIVMLKSVLSSVPLYTLSLHRMPVWAKKQMDSIFLKFLWQGTEEKKKYALVAWKKICNSIHQDGWGSRTWN